MIYETCKEFDLMEGIAGVNAMLLIICGTCGKQKKCHAEIRKAKEAK